MRCVYKLSFTGCDKVYIGSTFNLERRKTFHLRDLRVNKHSNQYLQECYNTYGEDCITFEVLEVIDNLSTGKTYLLTREKHYLDSFNKECLLNIDLFIINPKRFNLSHKNNKYKPKHSLSFLLLKRRLKYKEDYLKDICVLTKVPLSVILSTVKKLINSRHLEYNNGEYTVVRQ